MASINKLYANSWFFPDADLIPTYYQCVGLNYWGRELQTRDVNDLYQADTYLTKALENATEIESHPGVRDLALARHTTMITDVLVREPTITWKILTNLGNLNDTLGRYEKAETFFKQALSIAEQRNLPAEIRSSIVPLAGLYMREGLYIKSVPLHKRMLALAAISASSINLASEYLGSDYAELGACDQGISLIKDAFQTPETRRAAPRDDGVSISFDIRLSLGEMYLLCGKPQHAIAVLGPLLKEREAAGGKNRQYHERVLLARAYVATGKVEEAKILLDTELESVDESHFVVLEYASNVLQERAVVSLRLGRLDEAEAFARRAVDARTRFRGDYPGLAEPLGILAIVQETRGRLSDAANTIRRATSLILQQYEQTTAEQQVNPMPLLPKLRWILARHMRIVSELLIADPAMSDQLTAETFRLSQLLHNGSVGMALAQMAARFSVRGDELGNLIRQQQAAISGSDQLGAELTAQVTNGGAVLTPSEEEEAKKIIEEYHKNVEKQRKWLDAFMHMPLEEWLKSPIILDGGNPGPPLTLEEVRSGIAARKLRTDLSNSATKLQSINESISKAYPKYAELISPSPIAVENIQRLLGAEEAVIVFSTEGGDTFHRISSSEECGSFVWLIRHESVAFRRIALCKASLDIQVRDLRESLSPVTNPEGAPFPLGRAYSLYADLLGPEIGRLESVKTLFVVPDGPLESLPLSILVTEAPAVSEPTSPDYQKAPWLARRFAIATLPTVSSLRLLRATDKKQDRAPDPFVGFGDPILGPPNAKELRGLSPSEASRSQLADINVLKQIPSLPESGKELRKIAEFLHAPPDALFLRERASIPNLFRTKMDRYKVVAFATHAEVAKGSLQGLAEPAIVLTPPDVATPENDGLLRASQVAQLSLNADWVVLSACNTAASDGTVGSPGLSGLAKAFFYAGARALLVSHWEVPSRLAATITTGMFSEIAAHPEIGGAEALRRSMMDLLDHPSAPNDTHPLAWAPFVVAGEGGAGR